MNKVVGLILSGGVGSRLGGVNKGLVNIEGKPLIQWVYDALLPQVDQVFISANENIDEYRSICPNILEDAEEFYRAGPLAGIQSLAMYIEDDDIVQVVTCDLPLLPVDLVDKQLSYLGEKQLDAVYPRDYAHKHYGLLMFRGQFIHQIVVLLQQERRRIRDFIAVMKSDVLFFENSEEFMNGNDWQSIERIAKILKERLC